MRLLMPTIEKSKCGNIPLNQLEKQIVVQRKSNRRLNATKCILVLLREKQFRAQISFVFYCFSISSIKCEYFDLRPALQLKMCHFTCTFSECKQLNFIQNVTYDLLAYSRRHKGRKDGRIQRIHCKDGIRSLIEPGTL